MELNQVSIWESISLATELHPVLAQCLTKIKRLVYCRIMCWICNNFVVCLGSSRRHLMWKKACKFSWYQTTMSGYQSPNFSSSWRRPYHRRKVHHCLFFDGLFHLYLHGKNWPHLEVKASTVSRLKMSWTKIHWIQQRFLSAKVQILMFHQLKFLYHVSHKVSARFSSKAWSTLIQCLKKTLNAYIILTLP